MAKPGEPRDGHLICDGEARRVADCSPCRVSPASSFRSFCSTFPDAAAIAKMCASLARIAGRIWRHAPHGLRRRRSPSDRAAGILRGAWLSSGERCFAGGACVRGHRSTKRHDHKLSRVPIAAPATPRNWWLSLETDDMQHRRGAE